MAPMLQPPLIFLGSFIALWTWKCAMMVLFQNAIIYNPYLPPDARTARIADFEKKCGGVKWREERIESLDGTEVALCLAEVPARKALRTPPELPIPVYILYFQGWLQRLHLFRWSHESPTR